MKIKKIMAGMLATVTVMGSLVSPLSVKADQIDAPYLALGADLNETEKSTVLSLLEINEEDLSSYQVITVTNADEHKYLDSYLDSSVIGTRALSSVLIEKKDKGNGIKVTTSNITYCTTGMYQNALATAGVTDADVRVAGPFNISGTAALVGAMEAYSNMTGETLKAENADAATEELVTTSDLGEAIGDKEQAEELVGAVKEAVVSQDLTDPEEIEAVIDDAAKEMNIQLSDEDKQKIVSLMEKISSLDLDVDSLKEQAKDLYNKLESLDLNINQEQVKGFFDRIVSWCKNIWNSIFG